MRYIALLRAVNVGGKHKIKMADLRDTFESIGLKQVQTYIQSGNVLFDSTETAAVLQARIERRIEERFGFSVDVVLRTGAELTDIIENSPFLEPEEAETDLSAPARFYVALLNAPPGEDAIIRLDRYTSEHEKFQVIGRDIYVFLNHGMRNSKLAPQVQKLGTPATARNWKTLTKLHAMANDASNSDG